MENYGSEIGQKMRSAVKAKLLELGTGGSSAYIDDELPDYVMIMVANKRSKQQMTTDLNLFLGSQTELFVTWLHEVLQKLQEVTLPAANASNKKRKSHTSTSEAPGKKDKRNAKKDKKGHKKSVDEVGSPDSEKPTTTTDAVTTPAINSITDVFAEDLLEKAKKTLDVTSSMKEEIKKKKSKRLSVERREEAESQKNSVKDAQEFDIPTIGEITSTTGGNGSGNSKEPTSTVIVSGNREKDLAELAEIQKKISAAKKHLRKIGEINAGDESEEDDDFLHLKDDEQENADYELVESVNKSTQSNLPKKPKSPIVFNKHTETTEIHQQTITTAVQSLAPLQPNREKETDKDKERVREREREKRPVSEDRSEHRRSVHERLGMKPVQVAERRPRQQKEIYVPAHRRKENENERANTRDRERERERDRERPRQRDLRDRSRERALSREKNRRERQIVTPKKRRLTPEQLPQSRSVSSEKPKQRVVSHVIVAPVKPIESSDNEDIDEKPVNSVIKVKPRPPVSPSRQACKNLLLRAVADAQRSTILVKTEKKLESDANTNANSRSTGERGVKLFSKSYRNRERLNRSEPSAELFRRTTRSLVVEVKTGKGVKRKRESLERCVENTEEYVPKMIIDGDDSQTDVDVYVPQAIEQSLDEVEKDDQVEQFEQTRQNTQFVVTLHGDKVLEKYRKRTATSQKQSSSPLPQVTSSSSVGMSNTEPSSTTGSNDRGRRRKAEPKPRQISTRGRLDRTPSNSPTSSRTPPPAIGYKQKRDEAGRTTVKEVKKIIIKNDTDEDEEAYTKKPTTVPTKRQAIKRHSDGSAANGYDINTEVKRTEKPRSQDNSAEERSTTPPLPPAKQSSRSCSEKRVTSASGVVGGNNNTAEYAMTTKTKHTPIKFTLKSEDRERPKSPKRARSRSLDHDQRTRCSSTERRKISIRTAEDKKYDNIPSLSSVTVVDSTVLKVVKPKERCKYHPNCTKQFCDFYHPTAPCKSFPNCKFADKCLYSHPKCKFDLACMSIDCNFAHSGPRDLSHAQLSAPPLSSHVIPVQNYKSISATSVATSTTGTMCKYYPNCTKVGCTFYHPKPCRYGKNCINKLECAYFHPEMQSSSKFKWVASIV